MKALKRIFLFSIIQLLLTSCCLGENDSISEDWIPLDTGLELARFEIANEHSKGDATFVILRIDPDLWDLTLLCAGELKESNHTAAQWCAKHDLVAATNAGMYHTDFIRHVGYLKNHDHVNSKEINHYQSVASFAPRREGLPAFRIHDLDLPGASMDSIKADYACVIQNLRLIKRPGKNRWPEQDKMWSEMALGEDRAGRALFIFCRQPYSMHDLNDILVALPIDLVCAQHLEGGPEAQVFLDVEKLRLENFGSYETDFLIDDSNDHAWPVPNVIGIRKKAATPDSD